MKRLPFSSLLLWIFILISFPVLAQRVGVGTTMPHSSAILDIQSTTKGFLLPRMTTVQRDAIVDPAVGLQIFNLDDDCIDLFDGAHWIKTCGMQLTRIDTVSAGLWRQRADFAGSTRSGSVGFSINGKGYVGTGNDGTFKNDLWEYNPETNSWSQKANVPGPGRQYASGFSIGQYGYIGTGLSEGPTFNQDFWRYNPASNSWISRSNFGGGPRLYATGFSDGTKGYIGTGWHNGEKKDFWEYNPSTNSWTQKADYGGDPVREATGFTIGNKGYMGTGSSGGTPKRDFWEYNPGSNTWTQKADFGGAARSEAVSFSLGNKGYLGIGTSGSIDFWSFNPDSNAWTPITDFIGSPRNNAIGFTIGSKAYVGLGNGTKTFYEYSTPGYVYQYNSNQISNDHYAVSDGAWTLTNSAVYNTNGGKVGIGTSTPEGKLHVEGGSDASFSPVSGFLVLGDVEDLNIVMDNNEIIARDSAGSAPLYLQLGSGNVSIGSTTSTNKLDVEGTLAVGSGYSGTSTAPTNGAIIEGSTGIGTNNPQTKFHIMGGSDASYAGTSGYLVTGDVGATSIVMDDNEIIARNNGASSPLYLQASGGDVGIGQQGAPSFKLEVNGSAGKPGGGMWSNSSDQRLKQDIQPYTDGLSSLLQINPVTFHYSPGSGYDPVPEYVGVIAQELNEVAPYMVSVSPKVLEDGSTGYLQVDMSATVFMLINAVKEQQATIDQLKAENASRANELTELKRMILEGRGGE